MIDEDLIVCGYQLDEEGQVKDLVLAYYDKTGNLKCRGKINLGVSKSEQSRIERFAQHNTISKPWFEGLPLDVVWLKLKLIGTAHYIHKTQSGNMRQPV